MLLFRSEDHVEAWCKSTSRPRGEVLTLEQVWNLSKAWYGNRISPAFRGRSQEEVMAVFESQGLTSSFWKF